MFSWVKTCVPATAVPSVAVVTSRHWAVCSATLQHAVRGRPAYTWRRAYQACYNQRLHIAADSPLTFCLLSTPWACQRQAPAPSTPPFAASPGPPLRRRNSGAPCPAHCLRRSCGHSSRASWRRAAINQSCPTTYPTTVSTHAHRTRECCCALTDFSHAAAHYGARGAEGLPAKLDKVSSKITAGEHVRYRCGITAHDGHTGARACAPRLLQSS